MHSGGVLLALVSYLRTCCVAISVTLAIICIEEDHEPLSLPDLKRIGRPSPFGRRGRGVYSAKENGSSLFLPGDLVKIFVLYNAGLFIRWKVLYIFKFSLKNFVQTKSFPWTKAGFFWPLKPEENLPAETTNTVFHFIKPLLIVMLFNLMFLFFSLHFTFAIGLYAKEEEFSRK